MCHSPHPGDSLWLYCHEWDVANMNMLHERGDTTIPPSSVRLQRHTTLHIITLDLIPSYLLLSASRAHSSEYFSFAWSSFIWLEIEFENYLHVVDTIGQWSMDEWTLSAAVSRVFRRDYDSFKSRLGPLPVIRPQVVLVRSTAQCPRPRYNWDKPANTTSFNTQ